MSKASATGRVERTWRRLSEWAKDDVVQQDCQWSHKRRGIRISRELYSYVFVE